MRIITCGAVCALALGPASAYADYSWELSGRAGQSESGGYLESEAAALSVAYHFDPVEDGSGPPALAGFFDPATSVSITASQDQLRTGGTVQVGPTVTVFEYETEVSDYAIGGQYLLPRSKWYAGGRYSSRDFDEPLQSGVTQSSTDENAYGLVAGKYFGTGATRLQLSLERSENETERSINYCLIALLCINGVSRTEQATDQARVDVMHVRRFRSATYALFGGVSEVSGRLDILPTVLAVPSRLPASPAPPGLAAIAGVSSTGFDLGPIRSYSVGAELYPIAKLGVRVGYSRFDGQTSQDDAIDLRLSWFFRPSIGLELSVAREESDFEFLDADRAALRVIGRR